MYYTCKGRRCKALLSYQGRGNNSDTERNSRCIRNKYVLYDFYGIIR